MRTTSLELPHAVPWLLVHCSLSVSSSSRLKSPRVSHYLGVQLSPTRFSGLVVKLSSPGVFHWPRSTKQEAYNPAVSSAHSAPRRFKGLPTAGLDFGPSAAGLRLSWINSFSFHYEDHSSGYLASLRPCGAWINTFCFLERHNRAS